MPESPIFKMIEDGVPTKELESFIKNNPKDINVRNEYKMTPAHWAARLNHTEVLEILIKNNANINAQDKYGETTVHKTVGHKDTKALEILIENNANINAQNKYGETPVYIAAGRGFSKALKILIKNNADINTQDKYGEAPVHRAAFFEHLEILQILVENKANLNVQDINGETPAHLAAENNHPEILKILAENKANLNVQNSYGKTPAHLAAENNHPEILKILAENKANLNVQNSYGKTPALWAIMNRNPKTLPWLSFYGADVSGIGEKYAKDIEIGKLAREIVDSPLRKKAFLMGLANNTDNFKTSRLGKEQDYHIRTSFLQNPLFDINMIKLIFDFANPTIKLGNEENKNDIKQKAIKMAENYCQWRQKNNVIKIEDKEEHKAEKTPPPGKKTRAIPETIIENVNLSTYKSTKTTLSNFYPREN